jgi:hypothetical protein
MKRAVKCGKSTAETARLETGSFLVVHWPCIDEECLQTSRESRGGTGHEGDDEMNNEVDTDNDDDYE